MYWGRRGEVLYNCPFMEGGVIIFSVQKNFFFFFNRVHLFLCISVILRYFNKRGKPAPSSTCHPLIGYSPEATPPWQTTPHHLLKNQKQSAGSSDSPSLSLCFSSTSLVPPSPTPSSVSPASEARPFCFYSERVSHSPAKSQTF